VASYSQTWEYQVLGRIKGKRSCVNGEKHHQDGPGKIFETLHRSGRACPEVVKTDAF